MNAESAKAMADPETGYAAMMSKAMTTAMRMARGDHVPMKDEEKLREYNEKLYAQAKEAQLVAMNDDPEECDSLYDKEGGEYDPEGKADSTEAEGNSQGSLKYYVRLKQFQKNQQRNNGFCYV